MFEVSGLTKSFRHKQVLSGVNFRLDKGEIVGLIGKNGAGKTTIIKTLTGIVRPDSGVINLDGVSLADNFKKLRNRIGILLEPKFFDYMSAYDNLKILSEINGNRSTGKVNSVLEFVGLSKDKRTKVREFSFGMKQRLGLGQALIHNPDVIILDEPTVGLDPMGMKMLKERLEYLSKVEKKSIMFSSHELHKVQDLCDRVLLLRDGVIFTNKKIGELHDSTQFYVQVTGLQELLHELAARGVKGFRMKDSVIVVEEVESLNQVLQCLYDISQKLTSIEAVNNTLFQWLN